ncbi:hypothetical protein [Gordonia sp. NPDC003422]
MSPTDDGQRIRRALLNVARERYRERPRPVVAAIAGALELGGPVLVDDDVLTAAVADTALLRRCGWRIVQPGVLWRVEPDGHLVAVIARPEVKQDHTPIADRRHGWRIWRVDSDGRLQPPSGGRRGTFRRRGNLYSAECPHHPAAEIPARNCICGMHYVGDWESFWAGVEHNILGPMKSLSEAVVTYGRAEGRTALDAHPQVWDSMRATRYRVLGALVSRGVEHLLPPTFDVPLRRLDWDAEPDKIARAATMLVEQVELQGDSR